MARTLRRGAISFGLIYAPVEPLTFLGLKMAGKKYMPC
jgi:hypothetical protein